MSPYQCIAACCRGTGDDREWAVIGATGSQLVLQSSNGAKATWPSSRNREQEPRTCDEEGQPTEKRIKLAPSQEQRPRFSILKVTQDQRYVVGVTAEDKCVRVLHIDDQWALQQVSERCMIRRPCSIALTTDGGTILVADKFGDVYELPLHPSSEDFEKPVSDSTEPKKFIPSASLTTVHSGRNRRTLEEQLKQAEKGPSQAKEAPMFKHELLLGHVSMLTDVAYATAGSHSYILTADRDEHIRVSRGPPQAHIIDGFCHGHEAFVNKLCLMKSGRLVSGGGDPELYVWDWTSHRLLCKIALREVVLAYAHSLETLTRRLPNDPDDFKVAVSGIWTVPDRDSTNDQIVVACEGVSALLWVQIYGEDATSDTIPLRGNALDLTFITMGDGICMMVVTIDHVHEIGTPIEEREDGPIERRVQCFQQNQDGSWKEEARLEELLEWFNGCAAENEVGVSGAKTVKSTNELRDMLYSVQKLRKRPGAEE